MMKFKSPAIYSLFTGVVVCPNFIKKDAQQQISLARMHGKRDIIPITQVPMRQFARIDFADSWLETNSKLSSEGRMRTVEEFLCPPISEARSNSGGHSADWVVFMFISARNQFNTWVAVSSEHFLFDEEITSVGSFSTLQQSGTNFLIFAASIISFFKIRFTIVGISAVLSPDMKSPSGWIRTLCVLSMVFGKIVDPLWDRTESSCDRGIADVNIKENSPRLLKLYVLWLCTYNEYSATTCPEDGCLVDKLFRCTSFHVAMEKDESQMNTSRWRISEEMLDETNFK
jgi:hypothetical protein